MPYDLYRSVRKNHGNRFSKLFSRIIASKDDVEDALVIDSERVPDSVRVGVTPDKVRQAIARLNSFKRDPRQTSAQRGHNANNNAICYLMADSAVCGTMKSIHRVGTRKHSCTLPTDDMRLRTSSLTVL